MSKYEVFSGPYFLAFDGIRRDTEYLSVFSPNTGKYGPEITPYLDNFHAVAYAKRVREKATKCSLKTTEALFDADGHVLA